MEYTVSLVGNPNVGKTSLYNRVTHSLEHVGNWHGVTVTENSKRVKYGDDYINMVDLPGLYSLSVYTPEEGITRDRIISCTSNIVVNVGEVNNLSRNLYLTLQLLELGVPVMLAVNMMDELDKRGFKLDSTALSRALGIPVIPMSTKYRGDFKLLMDKCIAEIRSFSGAAHKLAYLDKLPLREVSDIIGVNAEAAGFPLRYAAVKALENDSYVLEKLALDGRQTEALRRFGDMQARVAQVRYEYIDEIMHGLIKPVESVRKKKATAKGTLNGFSGIDKAVLNKYFALPVFLLVMACIFFVTFGLAGNFFTRLLEFGIDKLIYNPLISRLDKINCPAWIIALIGDGIIHGVGGILVFLPQIVLLFFFLALLEDSGYISRVAFMTDGIFRKIGLSGRSAFTMLMGFGCSATAVLTARGLEDDIMRKKTVILTPFMSCSARLPVYSAICAAFFAGSKPFLIFGMYLLGAVVSFVLAAVFEKCIKPLKSGKQSFIMEMPPYRVPTAERVWQIIWHNAKVFIVRVGTVIFALNVIVWLLSNFSFSAGYTVGKDARSILEVIGGFVSPIFKPLGFGNWRAVTSLLGGLVAKEAVVASIESLGGVKAIFAGAYPSLSAISFMTFTLLYVPCVATLAAIRKETGTKWMLFSLFLQICVAYSVSLVVYTAGLLFILYRGVAFGALIMAVIIATCTFILYGRVKSKHGCPYCSGACGCCTKTEVTEK